ncbi:hypothetical protein [Crenothrix sp.]|uniref:hypothetical protein n=1 Tax=Crenothrix sp. TaxID=3100433 RepID=UPI00374DAC03
MSLYDFSVRNQDRFLYENDFVDAWLHEFRIEKCLPFNSKRTYSVTFLMANM